MKTAERTSNFRCEAITGEVVFDSDCGHGADPWPQDIAGVGLSTGKADDQAVAGVDKEVLVVNAHPALTTTWLSKAVTAVVAAINHLTTFRRR